ncbi:DNA polymerase Y family protein [Paracoccus sp. S-4012]|uniref:Y-family DNA polymerase n=1 Tax=Paracoccus sp. S-4012 TaxID=2665648 RepID=UPI0012AFC021|nr:DNA polymerase Y family protein [Paracoccus sp. S-4012]MRX49152.1 DNA polymerase Y family protein [Paracoccus sp. S-4012]
MHTRVARRIVAVWLPRLAVETAARHVPEASLRPFALVTRSGSADRLAGVTLLAAKAGLRAGMNLADARALQPELATRPHDPEAEARALTALTRWAGRFSPWVGREADGLALDLTGSAHLFGGEVAAMERIGLGLARAGLTARLAAAPTRGAAHALARFGPPGASVDDLADLPAALGPLPPAALRLAPETCERLARLGLDRIAQLLEMPRGPLARRMGPELILRLDQALGAVPEPVTPEALPPVFAARLTLPEPIGLLADLAAGLERLLARLCERLEAAERGALTLVLEARRVDGSPERAAIRLARPMRDPAALARLMAPKLDGIEAGFGIDALRLSAPQTGALRAVQAEAAGEAAKGEALADLVSRLGNRLGFEAVTAFRPAASHLPDRSFQIVEARFAPPPEPWHLPAPRPLRLFPPEPVLEPDTARQPTEPPVPARFRWRRMVFSTVAASGPERIAPEWWFDLPVWRTGPRDYWRVVTEEGRMLWLYRALGEPGWWAEGEFG